MQLGCTVVAGGLGFVVGHMRALAFLYDSLGRLPELAEKVRSQATMRNVSFNVTRVFLDLVQGSIGLGLGLVVGLYVMFVLLPLAHLARRVQAGTPQGLSRTCADEQLRRLTLPLKPLF